MDGQGWAAHPGGFEPNGHWAADAGQAVDVGLRELSQRLDRLLERVKMLGAEGHWSAPPQPEPTFRPPEPQPALYQREPPVLSWEGYVDPPPPPAPVYGGWANAHVPLIEVATADVGPFADLVELRHFEEALSELAHVRDVRVRRFGHHRASIEVAISSAPLLSRELALLGREMAVGVTPEGELVVELVPRTVPATDHAATGDGELPPAEGGRG